MDFEKWLKKNISAVVLSCAVVLGLAIWAGVAIHHHVHDKTLEPTIGKPAIQYSGTATTGSPTVGDTQSSTTGNGLDADGCYTPSTVSQYENTNGCVDFNVGYAYKDTSGTVFIDQLRDYSDGVEVYIPWNAAASDINYQALVGKNIKVTGPISNYNGAPQITVTELSQIQIYNN